MVTWLEPRQDMRGTDGKCARPHHQTRPQSFRAPRAARTGLVGLGARHSIGVNGPRPLQDRSVFRPANPFGTRWPAISGYCVTAPQATSAFVLWTRMPTDWIAASDVATFVFQVAFPAGFDSN